MFLVQGFHQLHQPFMADGCLNAGQFVQMIPSYLISSFLQWKSAVLLNMGWVWKKDNELDTGRNVACIYYLCNDYHLWVSYVCRISFTFHLVYGFKIVNLGSSCFFQNQHLCNLSPAISFRVIGKDSLMKAWKKINCKTINEKTWKNL